MLSAEQVTVSLSERRILHGVDLDVGAGEWVGIVGPNGAGKTTLIRALGGLIPFDGQVTLDGRPIQAWPSRERARRIALVSQTVTLAFDFTVRDLVLLGRSPHHGWLEPLGRADHEHASRALESVDLAGFEDRSVLTLSGGERRRALLAQALAQDAPVLLLDEPTSHLDVQHQFAFMSCVRDLVDAGRSVVGVFHNLELAARFSDRILVLQSGKVAAHGLPAEALSQEVIRTVFSMAAEISEEDGRLRIDYRDRVKI
ncbi:MAG: ABC transporter ATP-binding protein [Rhodothermales bacterium]|nr:ABC transporter ATP-binding protein [Rhodothermales bacterium]MBO6780936.1 ABC transporter ATP-binding protein [Rhodothermales bacterium]